MTPQPTRFERFRLFVGTLLLWIAARIMPYPMNIMIGSCLSGCEGLANEMASGRTFGVMTIAWGLGDYECLKGRYMQSAAMASLAKARAEIEEIE